MPLGMEVGLVSGDFVLDGDLAPQKKGHSPHPILAHVYCGQTAGWMKMPLGTEVDLSSGNIVLDGDQLTPLPPLKGHSSPRPFFSTRVSCRHGRPSQLLLSSCYKWLLLDVKSQNRVL